MKQFRVAAIVVGALVASALCGAAWAQRYPDKPVRIVVPYVVGGNLDLTARLFANGE